MRAAAEGWRLGHRPSLDGLRGVAILLVLLAHALPDTFPYVGAAGVALFFALSGFLITTLLLERRDRSATSGLRRFYARRARRLLPAVGVFLAVVGVCSLRWSWLASPTDLFASAFYLENVQVANHAGGGALAHLWSLSVEEQFYLLWPGVLMLALRRGERLGLVLAVIVLVASLADRLWLLGVDGDGRDLYYGSATNASLLAVGCVAAFAARSGWLLSGRWFWPLLTAVAVAAALPASGTTLTFAPVAVAGAGALAVQACCGDHSPTTPSWLNLVGRRSYALYLWQYPLVLLIPDHLPLPHAVTVPTGLALAWTAAWLSWVLVERPALRVRGAPRLVLPAAAAEA